MTPDNVATIATIRYFAVVNMILDGIVRAHFKARVEERFNTFGIDAYWGGCYCTLDGAHCDAACRGAGRCLA